MVYFINQDQSVLEMMHLNKALILLNDKNTNIFSNFENHEKRNARQTVIQLVLIDFV